MVKEKSRPGINGKTKVSTLHQLLTGRQIFRTFIEELGNFDPQLFVSKIQSLPHHGP